MSSAEIFTQQAKCQEKKKPGYHTYLELYSCIKQL